MNNPSDLDQEREWLEEVGNLDYLLLRNRHYARYLYAYDDHIEHAQLTAVRMFYYNQSDASLGYDTKMAKDNKIVVYHYQPKMNIIRRRQIIHFRIDLTQNPHVNPSIIKYDDNDDDGNHQTIQSIFSELYKRLLRDFATCKTRNVIFFYREGSYVIFPNPYLFGSLSNRKSKKNLLSEADINALKELTLLRCVPSQIQRLDLKRFDPEYPKDKPNIVAKFSHIRCRFENEYLYGPEKIQEEKDGKVLRVGRYRLVACHLLMPRSIRSQLMVSYPSLLPLKKSC